MHLRQQRYLKTFLLMIQQGICCSLGPSGAGKSLMHILGLLQPPQHGDYWLNGQHINKLNNTQKAHMAIKPLDLFFNSITYYLSYQSMTISNCHGNTVMLMIINT